MNPQLHNSTTPQLLKPKIFSSLLALCLVVFMMSFAEIIAQNNEDVHYYYLTEESYDLLKPTSTTTNHDRTLSLGINTKLMINNQTNIVDIPLHYLTVGAYIVNLVIDGNIVDAKHLIKQ